MVFLVSCIRTLSWLYVVFASAEAFSGAVSPLAGYNLSWSVDAVAGTITVQMQAPTAGWVGFGFTEAGGMDGADILVGWVSSNGVANVSDYWAFGNAKPVVDACQSWQLVASQNSETCSSGTCLTTIVATRALATGDTQDRDLVDDGLPNQIIVAYGSTDTFSYHGNTNRATTAVNFFRAAADPLQSLRSDSTVYTFEQRAGNVTIPIDETTYANFCVDVSGWNVSHLVGFEAVIDPPASKQFVHHYVYQAWNTPDCSGSTYMSAIWLWTPGVPGMALPLQAGYRVGNNTEVKGLLLEIHYDNPAGMAGIKDNSGIRSFVTQNLRQYDAGVLQVGDPTVFQRGLALPTGNSKSSYSCLPAYTTVVGSNNSLTAFGRMLHMHSKGVKFVSRQYSRAGSLRRIAQTEYYNWHFQGVPRSEMTVWDILPGDQFKVDCYFDTGSAVTLGLGSADEMCIDFIYYFPYMPTAVPNNMCLLENPAFAVNTSISVPSGSDVAAVSLFLNRTFGKPPATCPVIQTTTALPMPTVSPTAPAVIASAAFLPNVSILSMTMVPFVYLVCYIQRLFI